MYGINVSVVNKIVRHGYVINVGQNIMTKNVIVWQHGELVILV